MERKVHRHWHGMLTVNNIDEIANLIREMLTGRRYTFVLVHEQKGFRPYVKASRELSNQNDINSVEVEHCGEGENATASLTILDNFNDGWTFSINNTDHQCPNIEFSQDTIQIAFEDPEKPKEFWVIAIENDDFTSLLNPGTEPKPFHESIIGIIEKMPAQMIRCVADFIMSTKVPKDHDKIIEAWQERLKELGFDSDYGVTSFLEKQKSLLEKKEEETEN